MPINTQTFGNAQAYSESNQFVHASAQQHQAQQTRSVEVQKYLNDVRFPANKNDLIEHAVEHQAPSRIIDMIQRLPAPEFGSTNATKLTVYNSMDELARDIDQGS